ncbi:HAMP domain-containing histidine kinase [Paenibacillus sp. MWE-103]|uniref:histidine kinase n=1 Tax=Paenibacillus artemisiicola TaxID=1172618 RepID=A0ABS3W8K3_9BACL|nr:HAMP domain-containing sensor histidine kinase [Paenibacillus artemisiicola]MBO7744652.1 HAMP domain-containing histidine kinase [Paenibacillus artemisiicola]
MSKLARKLMTRVTLALCAVFVLSFTVNTYFLPKYFLHQYKTKLAAVVDELSPLPYGALAARIPMAEKSHDVTIVHASLSEPVDDVNGDLLQQLGRKGIALGKFWLTEESIAKLAQGGRVNKIYDQTKLKSSFLVNYFAVGGAVFAVGESISHSSETIRIVNRFNAYIWLGMLLLLVLLSALYTARIVKPLGKLNKTAESIAGLEFAKADIRTGDEIESLARSLNRMSDKLEDAHRSLEAKNANLRTFISDVSHELKTPLSLIRMYASGMRDGLDDGTYAGVIGQQSDAMAEMIDRLLELSRLQEDTYAFEPVAFKALLAETLADYRAAFRGQGLELAVDDRLPADAMVLADCRKLASVLRNWLTNALKYASGPRVDVASGIADGAVYFRVANDTDAPADAEWARAWEPFYVMERSRNKKLSGTGLGLSIARAVLERHGAAFGASARDGRVTFAFSLPVARERGRA